MVNQVIRRSKITHLKQYDENFPNEMPTGLYTMSTFQEIPTEMVPKVKSCLNNLH